MRWYRLIAVMMIFILLGGALFISTARSHEFSASLVGIDSHGNAAIGTLNVANGKVRMETPEVPTGFFLFTGDVAYFVRPGQRVFMDAKQSSLLAQLFIPVSPDTPCEQWQARAKLSGAADNSGEWRCDHIGEETVDERSIAVFEAISPRHTSYTVWIDKELNFPVGLVAEDGSSYRLQHIDEKPQLQNLFVVPRNYSKFDPQKLIDRLKQSDVWVIETPP